MIEPQTGNVFFLEKGEVVPNDVVEHAGELTLDKPSGIKLLGRRFTKGTGSFNDHAGGAPRVIFSMEWVPPKFDSEEGKKEDYRKRI